MVIPALGSTFGEMEIGDVEGTVGVYAVLLVKLLGEFMVERQEFAHGFALAVGEGNDDGFHVFHFGAAASVDDFGVGCGAVHNRLPFTLQRLVLESGKPIHVVEKDVAGDALIGGAEEALDGIGMGLNAIHKPGLQRRKVVGLQVLRAAFAGVAAFDISTPEVVIGNGKPGENGLQAILHKGGDAVFVVELHLLALGAGNAEHGKSKPTSQEPFDDPRPEVFFDVIIVEFGLFFECLRRQEPVKLGANLGVMINVEIHHAGHGTGGTVEEEGMLPIKEVMVFAPVVVSPFVEVGFKLGFEQGLKLGEATVAKHAEKVVELEFFDGCNLEVEEGVLAGIHVHGVDFCRAEKGVVQGVASGAGNHEDGILGSDFQGHAVKPGIFPAAVVHEVVTVDIGKGFSADPILNGFTFDLSHGGLTLIGALEPLPNTLESAEGSVVFLGLFGHGLRLKNHAVKSGCSRKCER